MFEFDIKALDYHWFWGMVYRTDLNGNVSPHLHTLATDSAYLKKVTDTVAQIGQKNLIARAIYRLFNIQQYAFYSNILGIYDMNHQEQPSETWVEATRRLKPDESNHYFIKMTSNMSIHLHILGLEMRNSEFVDWHIIRKTYLRLVRIHHPDKGGAPQRFIEIQTAYEALEQFKQQQEQVVEEDEASEHLHRYDYYKTKLEQAEQHLNKASELYPEFSVFLNN